MFIECFVFRVRVIRNFKPSYGQSSEGHLHVGIHEILNFARESFLHVRHDTAVHFRQPVGSVHFHDKPGALPLDRHAIRKQQILLDIVLVLLTLRWNFDGVAFPNHSHVALQVAFRPAGYVVRVRQQRPFVVKLVIYRVKLLSLLGYLNTLRAGPIFRCFSFALCDLIALQLRFTISTEAQGH